MKTLGKMATILLLSAIATAQKAPVSFIVSKSEISMKNSSDKALVAVVLSVEHVKHGMVVQHDFYFKPGNAGPASVHKVRSQDRGGPFTNPRLLFVQFEDGSTWGDTAYASNLTRQRKIWEAYLDKLEKAYNNDGEQGLVNVLQNTSNEDPALGLSTHLMEEYEIAGRDSLVNHIQALKAAAETRRATGNF